MEQVTLSHARQESTVKPRATLAPFAVRIKFLVAPVGPAVVPVARSVLLPRGGPRLPVPHARYVPQVIHAMGPASQLRVAPTSFSQLPAQRAAPSVMRGIAQREAL